MQMNRDPGELEYEAENEQRQRLNRSRRLPGKHESKPDDRRLQHRPTQRPIQPAPFPEQEHERSHGKREMRSARDELRHPVRGRCRRSLAPPRWR